MCTVTFVPGLVGGGYLLASNRDESPRRVPALAPYARQLGGRLVLAPRDGEAGGSWIGVDEQGRALCVLNGDAPAPAKPLQPAASNGSHAAANPPRASAHSSTPDLAPPSRGLLVNELFADPRPDAVRAELERRHAAGELRFKPFKLAVVEPGPAFAWLFLAEWNGQALSFARLHGPQCLVSSTFEREAVTAARRAAFEQWYARQERGLTAERLAANLADFHAGHAPGAPEGDAFSVCMHRADARTVSSTLVHVASAEIRMRYLAGWPCQDPEPRDATLARR
ncbi:MAG: NRDE family protein [Planctomycetota bacterium]